ncbi:MAG: amidohydrolase family protein [Pseudomonadota bacterium]
MPRPRCLAVLVLFLLVPGFARAATTAFVGGVLVDGTGGPPVPASVVLVEGDRIRAAGPFCVVPIPLDAVVVNVAGRWLVPGLVDPHIHFFQSGGLYTRPDIVDLRALRTYEDETAWVNGHREDVFRRYVASGVTAVVDVGGPFSNFEVRALRDQVDVAPRVAVAGPLISTVSRPQLDIGDPPIIQVADANEARALVARQLERKPDLIKIWYIVPEDGDPRANLPLARAVIDTAHAGGVRVAVHATQREAARAVVEAGADILVHAVDDAPVDAAFVSLLKARGTIITSTLVVYEGYGEVLTGTPDLTDVEDRLASPAVRSSWAELAAAPVGTVDPAAMQARKEKMRSRIPVMQANLKILWDAGVIVAAGTDAGNIGTVHGPAMHRELELLVAAGLTPGEVLVAATRNAAQIFAAAPDFGTVTPGKLADFLILDADPLADVRALRRIHRVVLGGRVLDPEVVVPQDASSVVRRMHDAFGRRDLHGTMSFFSDESLDTSFDTGRIRDREAIQEEHTKAFALTVPWLRTVRDQLVTGDFVVEAITFAPEGSAPDPTEMLLISQTVAGGIRRTWNGKAQSCRGAIAPVQGQVDAYNARDIDAFASFYAQDLKIYRLPEGELILDGRDALHERYAEFFELSPELRCTVVDRLVFGPWVVDREVVTGARAGAPLRAVAVYKVEGDHIKSLWFLPREGP